VTVLDKITLLKKNKIFLSIVVLFIQILCGEGGIRALGGV